MITPVFQMEILLLPVLLSEEPLPFLKSKAFGLVGPGDLIRTGLSDATRPCDGLTRLSLRVDEPISISL